AVGVDVGRRGRVAGDGLHGAVTPVDGPVVDGVHAGVAGRRQVQRVGRALVDRAGAADDDDRGHVVDGDGQPVRRPGAVLVGGGALDGEGGGRVGVDVRGRGRVADGGGRGGAVAPVEGPGGDGVLTGVAGGHRQGVQLPLVDLVGAGEGQRRRHVADADLVRVGVVGSV